MYNIENALVTMTTNIQMLLRINCWPSCRVGSMTES